MCLQELLANFYIGALTANLISLGDKLGLYAALKHHGPCTAAELAKHQGLNARYISEWLRQQASARVISTDEAAEKYWLTQAQQDCLVHESGSDASPFYSAGGFMAVPGLAKMADERLPTCFKDGSGISYNEIDPSVTCGTCRELGVWLRHSLVPSLRGMPGMEAKLEKGCKVADVGCGCGEALLTVAAAFPSSTFHGYDISEDALRSAKAEAGSRGLTNLVMTHDAIHDMAHPQKVMAAVRKAVATDGHAANVHSHPLAAYMYGFSCHLCLPSGMSAPGGAALGTLGIPAGEMCRMMKEAGFGSAEVLDWDHPWNRQASACSN
ncbi:hypothetical protein CHLNCDRAFT_135271 [Chlorella variabilis]|uniref:Uncharacterized protein n=1 Tax=Chlorella variabilis TaxID=554065 RepID=E1ZHV3_CHLVA|nr:hypothetical protein CHLNCDRAFT_135271 [Chlorella variabilis]EFN54527.1 hypothetical protein CHLNCDRAFT_135271 [Chlorella variabilis]|eukprot:XP_005846629.1 hypothetical protein CHLNCDRAFT_135271 [Chlorella variabilis]